MCELVRRLRLHDDESLEAIISGAFQEVSSAAVARLSAVSASCTAMLRSLLCGAQLADNFSSLIAQRGLAEVSPMLWKLLNNPSNRYRTNGQPYTSTEPELPKPTSCCGATIIGFIITRTYQKVGFGSLRVTLRLRSSSF